MQRLDETAVDADRPLAGACRLRIGGDEVARPRDFRGRGAKGGIGRVDLGRVDQGLAVETEIPRLSAGRGKTLRIIEVEMNPVEDRPAMRAPGEQYEAER